MPDSIWPIFNPSASYAMRHESKGQSKEANSHTLPTRNGMIVVATKEYNKQLIRDKLNA